MKEGHVVEPGERSGFIETVRSVSHERRYSDAGTSVSIRDRCIFRKVPPCTWVETGYHRVLNSSCCHSGDAKRHSHVPPDAAFNLSQHVFSNTKNKNHHFEDSSVTSGATGSRSSTISGSAFRRLFAASNMRRRLFWVLSLSSSAESTFFCAASCHTFQERKGDLSVGFYFIRKNSLCLLLLL